ncbi:MAG TPA: amidohydrolase family protein, partial [Bdellovibrionales bacterium]|nr:amidohydrolase family protein [Bdellovibrionales bacterium]
ILQEMDTAAKLQKVFLHDNSAMGAVHALDLATLSGAEALGLGDKVGSLEAGKAADLIVVGLSHPHLQPLHDVPSQLAYSATGLEVETVFCNGKLLFDRGEFKTLDANRILAEAEVWRDRIRKKVEELEP